MNNGCRFTMREWWMTEAAGAGAGGPSQRQRQPVGRRSLSGGPAGKAVRSRRLALQHVRWPRCSEGGTHGQHGQHGQTTPGTGFAAAQALHSASEKTANCPSSRATSARPLGHRAPLPAAMSALAAAVPLRPSPSADPLGRGPVLFLPPTLRRHCWGPAATAIVSGSLGRQVAMSSARSRPTSFPPRPPHDFRHHPAPAHRDRSRISPRRARALLRITVASTMHAARLLTNAAAFTPAAGHATVQSLAECANCLHTPMYQAAAAGLLS